MGELKYSRQREAILEALILRHDHPTADTLPAEEFWIFPWKPSGTWTVLPSRAGSELWKVMRWCSTAAAQNV